MVQINRSMGAAEWAMLVSLSILWGGSFFFTKLALGGLPPLTLVLARVGLASLVLALLLYAKGERLPRDVAAWRAFAGMAILNNAVPFVLLVWAQTRIGSGLASILNATTPLWTVLVAHLATGDERATPNRIVGTLLGFVGVAVMIGSQALHGSGVSVLAQAGCLVATLSYACAGVFGRRFRRMGIAPLATACGQLVAATVVLAPIALVVDTPWRLAPPSSQVILAVLGLVLLSTATAYVLYFRLLARAGATNLLLVTFLIPVTAVLLGTAVLGETLALRHVLGMIGIALGLIAIDGRLVHAAVRCIARAPLPIRPERDVGRDI